MFERKNQNILSEHYSKLIDHEDATDDGDEDFITLKRANHELPNSNDLPDPDAENMSRRKLKLSKTKRMVAKYGQLGHKLIFDDEGNPHEIYEMVDPEEFYKHGVASVKEAGRVFVEGEKGKLKDADVVDKEEAKEKKKEKKRKRKDRERGVSAYVSWPCLRGLVLISFSLEDRLRQRGSPSCRCIGIRSRGWLCHTRF
jgi:ATP-dependent RNA helicase DDX10/DBP4